MLLYYSSAAERFLLYVNLFLPCEELFMTLLSVKLVLYEKAHRVWIVPEARTRYRSIAAEFLPVVVNDVLHIGPGVLHIMVIPGQVTGRR